MSQIRSHTLFGIAAFAIILAMRWPAGAQALPASSPPLMVKILPLARDLATFDGTTLAVPSNGTAPVVTVPAGRYLVVTEIRVTGLIHYGSNATSLPSNDWDLVDTGTGDIFLQGDLAPGGSLASATGTAIPPGTPLAFRYVQDPGWGSWVTTADVHYHVVGYFADR